MAHYQTNPTAIDHLLAQPKAHGMFALGEHVDVDLELNRKILEASFR